MASGGIQFWSADVHKTLDGGLVSHIVGASRPDSTRNITDWVEVLHRDDEGARAALLADDERRKAHEAVDFLFVGPPGYATPGEWGREAESAWARDVVAWARQVLGPESVIVATALHRDESSPHVHLLAVPRHNSKVGWTALVEAAALRLGGIRTGRKKGKAYRVLQDHLHKTVSVRYGLGRGAVGSEATHEATDRAKGVERKVQILAVQARGLAEGDERIGKSFGITLSADARKALEAERDEAAAVAAALERQENRLIEEGVVRDVEWSASAKRAAEQTIKKLRDQLIVASVFVAGSVAADDDVLHRVPPFAWRHGGRTIAQGSSGRSSGSAEGTGTSRSDGSSTAGRPEAGAPSDRRGRNGPAAGAGTHGTSNVRAPAYSARRSHADRELERQRAAGVRAANRKTSGFLPEECAELDRWLAAGWVDTFRARNPGATGQYTWWAQRSGARARNVGWRIDYGLASPGAMRRVRDAFIRPHVTGSDHCPIGVDVED